jgi:DNA-binding transcriptional regulator YdaS (Cro superfamily)
MNLNEKLSSGGTVRLANYLGIKPPVVSAWLSGRQPIPAHRCIAIEKFYAGEVTCEELRPEIDWGYLRGTSRRKDAA